MPNKGVSPVVATVLLVAVAVAIGISVTTWITHVVSKETTAPGLICAPNTNYDIDSVRFNETGNDFLVIKITNKRTQPLHGFGVVLDNGSIILRLNSSDPLVDQGNITAQVPLQTAESAYIKVNLTNETLGHPTLGKTLTEVKVLNDVCNTVSQSTTTITKY